MRMWAAVLCGLTLVAACTSAQAEVARPEAEVARDEPSAPVPEPTPEPAPNPTAVPVDLSTGLSDPILVSDGESIMRVQPDGTIAELYRAESPGSIRDFASDGRGGVLFQEDREQQDYESIAWLVDGEVSYPIVAEPGIRLDLVGALLLDGGLHMLYQHLNPCCGALESVGTLRLTSLERSSEWGLRYTGAWETSTDFSALTSTTAVAIEGAIEGSTVLEIDPITGETLASIDAEDLYGAVVRGDQGLLAAEIKGAAGDAALTISTIDQVGKRTAVASTPTDAALTVADIFIEGDIAVVSLQQIEGSGPAAARVVDLADGTTRELAVQGIARPDEVPVIEYVTGDFAELSFSDVLFDDFRLGMAREDLIEAMGQPDTASEFEWGGDLIGYRLDYGDLFFELHYGVSFLEISREGICTPTGVCIGDSFESVEVAHGFGWVTTDYLTANETRSLDYSIPDIGYCNATFTFGYDDAGVERLQEISARCLPD